PAPRCTAAQAIESPKMPAPRMVMSGIAKAAAFLHSRCGMSFGDGFMTAAELQWRDGCVPVSTRFDDPFFSLADGLAETRHVFLAGNDLPARFRDGFHIAE